MSQEVFDFVIPLFKARWNTRAVFEGITAHYSPRSIHVVTPATEARSLREVVGDWQTAPLYIHEEEVFFAKNLGLTKDAICAELDLGESLYNPGWFYQQLLKLGTFEGLEDLSEWYVVWDSDLLPVATWPLISQTDDTMSHTFALIQHNGWGNPAIVSKWEKWINTVLGVPGLMDAEGTFVPHHMWFKQEHLKTFAQQLSHYYDSSDHWLLLMMRSANDFGTFSEYWSYVSWVAAKAPQDLTFHAYDRYGATTERFFDDGTGIFSAKLREHLGLPADLAAFSPTYTEVDAFIQTAYGADRLPSSLSFESSPRHLKKNKENMHIEELRSRWNPRMVDAAAVETA